MVFLVYVNSWTFVLNCRPFSSETLKENFQLDYSEYFLSFEYFVSKLSFVLPLLKHLILFSSEKDS